MKNKLKMVKHMKTAENGLLRAVAETMMGEGSGGWMKQVGEYMRAVGVSIGVIYEELTRMKKEKNNFKVNEWEERRWRTEVEERETPEIYRVKNKIGEEGLY